MAFVFVKGFWCVTLSCRCRRINALAKSNEYYHLPRSEGGLLMIVDAHVHVSTGKKEGGGQLGHPLAQPDRLLKEMDKNGIDKVVVFPFTGDFEENKALAQIVRKYADRLIQFAFISPKQKDAKEQFMYCLGELGVRGLKLHPRFGDFHVDDIELLGPILEVCNERRLHIIIHCTSDDHRVHPFRIETLAKMFPKATFQIAHMGTTWSTKQAIAVAKRNQNVYVDTAAVSFEEVREAVVEVPDKVLMGSDFPFYRFEMEVLKLRLVSGVIGNSKVLEKVMGGNMAYVLGWSEQKGVLKN